VTYEGRSSVCVGGERKKKKQKRKRDQLRRGKKEKGGGVDRQRVGKKCSCMLGVGGLELTRKGLKQQRLMVYQDNIGGEGGRGLPLVFA